MISECDVVNGGAVVEGVGEGEGEARRGGWGGVRGLLIRRWRYDH